MNGEVSMALFRKTGKIIGTVGGGIIGGAVKVAGKAVGTKWKGTGEWSGSRYIWRY